MNEANMFLHLILLIMVSLDIRATERNRRLHEQTQAELIPLRLRLERIYRTGDSDNNSSDPQAK